MPTKFRVNIGRTAERDIEEIWSYIAAENPNAASSLLDQLDRQVKTLERFPERCPLIAENELLSRSYRHLIYGNYRTIFRIDGRTVHVLRVIHGARLLDTSLLEKSE